MIEKKQGELYHQLGEYTKDSFEATTLNEVETTITCLFDEAKAAFPKYPNIINYPNGGKEWFDALDKYDHEVEAWFLKWFGDSHDE